MNFSRTILGGFVLLAAFVIFFNFGYIQTDAKGGFLDNVFSIASFADDEYGCCEDEDYTDDDYGVDVGSEDDTYGCCEDEVVEVEDDTYGCCDDDDYVEDDEYIEEPDEDLPDPEIPPPTPKQCILEISKSADATNVTADAYVYYTINFKNIGTKDCTGGGVQVVDVVDSRLTYLYESHSSDVSAGYGGDPIYKASDRTLRWNAHTLTPGESGWVKWKAKVGYPETCSEVVPNTAKITAYEYDNFTKWVYSNTVNLTLTKDCYQQKTPVCTLLPDEQYINKGESAKLTWTSQYATTGVMDEEVGSLTPVAGGFVNVSPLVTTSYKAVFTGPGGEIACHATVKVKSTPSPKYCQLEISKSADVTSAAPGTYVWYTINFKNIGTKDCTGGGVQVLDVVDSRLEYIEESHSPDVNAGYGGDPIYKASDRTLRWNANTLTPGESGWVKWKAKVGTPTACSETIPNTAKITAYEYDTFTRFETSNTVNVAVSRNCTNPAPVCSMTISKSQMAKGDTAVLSWTGTNVNTVTIDNGIGATTTVNGGITVQPQDNSTYTGTFTGQYGTVTCQAAITITTGGGGCSGSCGRGQQPPKVVLYQKPQLQPLAAVYLSQVPYTGFDAGPITTAVYWTLLVLWSALVAYFLVYRGFWGKILPASGSIQSTAKRTPRVTNTIEEEFEAEEEEAVVASTLAMPAYVAPTFTLPTREVAVVAPVRGQTEKILMPTTEVEKTVEKTLGEDRILISKHGMELIAEAAQDGVDLLTLLGKLSYAARRNYPREDGWIALSDERITETLHAVLPSLATAAAAKVAVKDSVSTVATMAAEAITGQKIEAVAVVAPSTFVQSLLKGEKDVVFAALRDAAGKGTVDTLMLNAVLELDRAYRARIEGSKGADATVVGLTAHMTTVELEELVRALSAAIDETYTSSLTAAKLALANALAQTGKKA